MAPRRIDPARIAPNSALARAMRADAAKPFVTVRHDGDAVAARDGEPLAIALLAAGRLTLARSVKYHRPRGATCLRGDCEGCLVRADGVGNVMACATAVCDGMDVRSQNAFPTAQLDVLRVTDWFFPKHLDHHHLLVHFGRALNRTMQVFARRMAGLGTLPDGPGDAPPAEHLDTDVLVVGAGTSGIACANTLVSKGLRVLLVEEREAPGGIRRDDPRDAGDELAVDARVTLRTNASALAAYPAETLVLADGHAMTVSARARVFATGCRDTVGLFAQNDLPGVFTARAASVALRAGVLVGERVVVVGDGLFAHSFAAVAAEAGAKVVRAPDAELVEALGSRAVKGAVLREGGSTRTEKCDAIAVETVPEAAYELAAQAGARIAWNAARDAFEPATDGHGRAARDVYVTGSVHLERVATSVRAADGVRVAANVAGDLGAWR